MSFALIDAKRAEVSVETACTALGVSVSGFYAWKNRPASARQSDDMMMLAHIRAEYATSNETYGSRRAGGARGGLVPASARGATHARRVERQWLGNRAAPCRRHVFDMTGGAADE